MLKSLSLAIGKIQLGFKSLKEFCCVNLKAFRLLSKYKSPRHVGYYPNLGLAHCPKCKKVTWAHEFIRLGNFKQAPVIASCGCLIGYTWEMPELYLEGYVPQKLEDEDDGTK